MSNRTLGLRVALRDPKALATIRKELERGMGAKATAQALGVGRTTLTRWGAMWPAVQALLDKWTFTPSEVGSIGGTTTQRNLKVRK